MASTWDSAEVKILQKVHPWVSPPHWLTLMFSFLNGVLLFSPILSKNFSRCHYNLSADLTDFPPTSEKHTISNNFYLQECRWPNQLDYALQFTVIKREGKMGGLENGGDKNREGKKKLLRKSPWALAEVYCWDRLKLIGNAPDSLGLTLSTIWNGAIGMGWATGAQWLESPWNGKKYACVCVCVWPCFFLCCTEI